MGDEDRLEELRRVLVGGPTPVTVVIADADLERARFDGQVLVRTRAV